MDARTLILDNGAYFAKVGLGNQQSPRMIPNCIMKAKSERRRPFIGDQIDECRDASGLYYILPFQKGYLVNFDIQKTVWDYMFSKECCDLNLSELYVVVTEPYFNFTYIREAMTEIFFEEFSCPALLRINSGALTNAKYTTRYPNSLCCLVVDSGYSFTYITPFVKGKKVKSAIRRIDVGGKLLTNHLKDLISYRQLNVMDETYVINQVKEDVCYVSYDFMRDMSIAKKKGRENTILQEYVLPDYTTVRRGYVGASDTNDSEIQLLRLNNERFSVPEILFHPSDIGISQMGIPEAIVNSIVSCPPETHPHLFANIILTGGCALFPGFKERVQKEVRSLAPDHYDVNIGMPPNPITYAWEGGAELCKKPNFPSMLVTKKQYDEDGFSAVEEKFDV